MNIIENPKLISRAEPDFPRASKHEWIPQWFAIPSLHIRLKGQL